MQKDALEPLRGNDSDDDVPVILSDATRDGGKLKPGAAIDTEEDIEMMDDVLTEVKEWLTFDVLYRTPLDNLLGFTAGGNKTTKPARAYARKVFVLLLVRYGIPGRGRSAKTLSWGDRGRT